MWQTIFDIYVITKLNDCIKSVNIKKKKNKNQMLIKYTTVYNKIPKNTAAVM